MSPWSSEGELVSSCHYSIKKDVACVTSPSRQDLRVLNYRLMCVYGHLVQYMPAGSNTPLSLKAAHFVSYRTSRLYNIKTHESTPCVVVMRKEMCCML